jgi:hypothetical protein
LPAARVAAPSQKVPPISLTPRRTNDARDVVSGGQSFGRAGPGPTSRVPGGEEIDAGPDGRAACQPRLLRDARLPDGRPSPPRRLRHAKPRFARLRNGLLQRRLRSSGRLQSGARPPCARRLPGLSRRSGTASSARSRPRFSFGPGAIRRAQRASSSAAGVSALPRQFLHPPRCREDAGRPGKHLQKLTATRTARFGSMRPAAPTPRDFRMIPLIKDEVWS